MLVNPISYGYGLDTAVQSLRRVTPYSGPLRTQDRLLDVANRQANGGSRVDPRQSDGLGYRQASNLQATVKAFEGAKANIAFGQKAIADAREAVKNVREMLTSIRDKVVDYRDNNTSAEEKRAIANEVITLQTRIEGTITRAQSQGVNLLTSAIKKVIDSTPSQLAATTRTTYDIDLNGDGIYDVSYDGTSSNALTLTPDSETGQTGDILASSTRSALLALNTDLSGGSDVNVSLQSALSAYQNGQQTSNATTIAFQAPGFGGSGGGEDDDDDRHRNQIGRGHREHGNGHGYGHDDHDGGGGGSGSVTASGSFTSSGSLGLTTTGTNAGTTGATSIGVSGSGLVVDFNGDGINDLTVSTSTTTNLSTGLVTDSGNNSSIFGSGSTQTNTSITYTSTLGGGGGDGGDDEDDDDRGDHGKVHGKGNAYGHGHGHGDDDDGGGSGGGTTVTTTINVATSTSATFNDASGASGTQSGGTTNTFAIDRDGNGTVDFAVRVTTTTTYDYSGFGLKAYDVAKDGGLPVYAEQAGVTDVPGVEFSPSSIGSNNINLDAGIQTALTNVEKSLKKTDLSDKYLAASAERLAAQDKQISATIDSAKGGIDTIFKADETKAKAFISEAEKRQETAKKAIAEGQAQAKAIGGLLINVQSDVSLRQEQDKQGNFAATRANNAYDKSSTGSALPPIRAIAYPIVAPTTATQARDVAPKPVDRFALPGIDEIA